MKKEKNIFPIILIAIIIVMVIISIFTGKKTKPDNDTKNLGLIETIETKECNKIPVLYYAGSEFNIYTYCLDEVYYQKDDTKEELRYILNGRYDEFTALFNKLGKQDNYEDGGTILYRDGGSTLISNNGLSILKCHTTEGNTDIYIGSKDMGYEEGFCKREHDAVETFIKTYTVEEVTTTKDQKYYELTLSSFQDESNVKVKIEANIIDKIEKGKNYEFTFAATHKNIKDNIKTIFKEAKLLKVRETNKQGLDQFNDSVR